MSVTWITQSGSLGTLVERISTNISLAATSSANGTLTFTVIAGKLPPGLRLNNNLIFGSPAEVNAYTVSKFVIRAADGFGIADRTFTLAVDGADAPQWITKEGFLNVGQGKSYFVLDNSYVDYQLIAKDSDEIAGDVIEYYISPMGGELPPGLALTKDGRIVGFTDPIFSIEFGNATSGAYDTAAYDITPLDRVEAKTNGFDSYLYDIVEYDYSEPSQIPRRLSRSYNFVVTASDGRTETKRLFRMWVVTEEFLQSDNSIIQVDTNLFTSDSSANRPPLWITEAYLGRRRANNYVTVFLDTYNNIGLTGTLVYLKSDTNLGTYKLKSSEEIITNGKYEISELYPIFKYRDRGAWRIGKAYAIGDLVTHPVDYGSLADPTLDSSLVIQYWLCVKDMSIDASVVPGEGIFWTKDNINTNSQTFRSLDPNHWEVIEPQTPSQFPPGLILDQKTGEMAGVIPYQSALTKTYRFTIRAVKFLTSIASASYVFRGSWDATTTYGIDDAVEYEDFVWVSTEEHRNNLPAEESDVWTSSVSISDKTFTLDIIGEIESRIQWITDSNLGSIQPGKSSTLAVEAASTIYGNKVSYELISGTLPSGLELLGTGNIQGNVKQFGDSTKLGLTRFTDSTLFDGGDTSFDRLFKFTIQARDASRYNQSNKNFRLFVDVISNTSFASVYLKAFQRKEKRLAWFTFITNSDIFNPEDVYRYGDKNFGIQSEIKIILFAGIETADAVKFVQTASKNHYNKKIKFGDIKVAEAKDPITQETIYEVVYVDMVDTFEKNGKSVNEIIQLPSNTNSKVLISYDSIKVDSDIPFASDSDHQRLFPNSIKNMRNRIKNIGERDRLFLPLWMRSIQSTQVFQSGFVKALPLCYAKPGKGTAIQSRINISQFDFKQIDFEADRYLIDVISGDQEYKYLAFPQTGEKLP